MTAVNPPHDRMGPDYNPGVQPGPGHSTLGPLEPAPPENQRRKRGSKSTDLPQIRLLSWLGLESLAWGAVIAHVIKWAVSFGYFAAFQLSYPVVYAKAHWKHTVVGLTDPWDRLPVHVANGLPGEIAVITGLAVAIIAVRLFLMIPARRLFVRIFLVLAGIMIGVVNGIVVAKRLAGWHVHWFATQAEPLWWITWRHDIRDVTIAVVATIIVELMFAKPKYPVNDNPGLRVYLTSVPLAIGAALVPIAAVGMLAWKLPWLTQHGLMVPAHYGVAASEINGWIAAGTWITVLMGILGGIAAKRIIQRVADDIQWFMAERSAAKIRSSSGLSALRGERVIGTPAHRLRVHWLLDNVTLSELPARNPWIVRGLLVLGFFTLVFAGAGAWLNLVGPAAPH